MKPETWNKDSTFADQYEHSNSEEKYEEFKKLNRKGKFPIFSQL